MATRLNPAAAAFVRGLELGRMYERRQPITTERVREIFGVSRATAKRDLAAMRRKGAQLPVRPPDAAPLPASQRDKS